MAPGSVALVAINKRVKEPESAPKEQLMKGHSRFSLTESTRNIGFGGFGYTLNIQL